MPKQSKPVVEPEHTVEMTPEQIAAAEVEKSALLAKLQARPVDLDLDGPTSSSKPSQTPAEIQALIDEELARHHATQESAEIAHKKHLDDLMAQQRESEPHQARQVDPSVKARLRRG